MERLKVIRRWLSIGQRSREAWPDALERVLGPTGPQVGCDECFARIDRYVELEAAGGDAGATYPEMWTHLEGCPACKQEHDDLLAYLTSR
jgi:hypothetical protein